MMTCIISAPSRKINTTELVMLGVYLEIMSTELTTAGVIKYFSKTPLKAVFFQVSFLFDS